jgi:hypothetical protein
VQVEVKPDQNQWEYEHDVGEFVLAMNQVVEIDLDSQ